MVFGDESYSDGFRSDFARAQRACAELFRTAFLPLTAMSSECVGGGLYVLPETGSDSLLAVDAFSTVRAAPSQEAFARNHIVNRRIFKAGTSLGESMQSREDIGVYRSGYRGDHLCLNFRFDTNTSGAGIIQLVFQRSDFFAGQGPENLNGLKSKISDTYYHSGLSVPISRMKNVLKQAQEDISSHSLDSPHRDMFVIFSDISGFTKIRQAQGERKTTDFGRSVRAQFVKVASSHGGDLYRSEGDGFWFMFPATDFGDSLKRQFFHDRILPAAQDLTAAYNRLSPAISGSGKPVSHLKTAIVYSPLKASASEGRYQKGILDGDAFFAGRNLSAAAPRDQDVILFEDAMVDFLPAGQKEQLIPLHVPDEKIGKGQALVVSPQ